MKKSLILLSVTCCLSVIFSSSLPGQNKPEDKGDKAAKKKAALEETVKDRDKKESRDPKAKNAVKLQEVVVKGDQLIKESPYSINTVTSDEIEKRGDAKSSDLIKGVPGIKVQDYGQGGISNAITMRGFNTGMHGGDMGVYLDGVPLNEFYGHGGGYADVNVLIPLELDRVQVYKGPSSALYGNFSRAGTLVYYTKKKDNYTDLFVKYGSWNTTDAQVALGRQIGENLWFNAAAQYYQTDGFQDNSRELMGNGSLRLTYAPTKDLEITASLRSHKDIFNAPGYISRLQCTNKDLAFKQSLFDPTNAAPVSINALGQNNGGEARTNIERLDVSYLLNEYVKVLVWGFGFQSTWTRFSNSYSSSQREQDYGVGKYGSGINANFEIPLTGDIKMKGILGYEFFRDDTKYHQWGTQMRVRTAPQQNVVSRFDTHALFFESEFTLHKLFRPTLGARLDMFAGDLQDRSCLANDPFGSALTASKLWHSTIGPKNYSHVSPKAGFFSTLVDDVLTLRGNVSNGYTMPPESTLFYTWMNIKPSNIWQYEVGSTLSYERLASLDVAGYRIDTTNETNESPIGSGVYRNNGTTRRYGTEVEAKFSPSAYFELKGTFSYNDTKVTKRPKWDASRGFSVSNYLIQGSPVPQIPDFLAGVAVNWLTKIGLGGSLRWNYVGRQYCDDYGTKSWSRAALLNVMNSTYGLGLGETSKTYSAYNLVDLGLSYRWVYNEKPLELRFDVKNVLNQHYATTVNYSGIWSPGMPRSYYASVLMKL